MRNLVLDDKMRIALDGLLKSQILIASCISELRQQNYTTEATNLEAVLASLIIRTDETLDAIR